VSVISEIIPENKNFCLQVESNIYIYIYIYISLTDHVK